MKGLISFFLLIIISVPSTLWACKCSNYGFNSTEELERYKFIGLVKIDSVYESPENNGNRKLGFFHEVSFSILELYKGDSIKTLQVRGGNKALEIGWTSCDLDISQGTEWVLLASEKENGQLITGACTYSRQYKSEEGKRDWLYKRGFEEIEKLRKLYRVKPAGGKPDSGVYKHYYKDGSIELEEIYLKGELHGKRKVYYPNGNIMLVDSFFQGQQTGRSFWYYLDGEVFRNCNFLNGKKADSCTIFYQNGKVRSWNVYSKDGIGLYGSSFGIDGNLQNMYERLVSENKMKTSTFFDSGEVHYISINDIDNFQNESYTQYYRNGKIERTDNDFEKGEIRSETKKYSEEGDLIFHRQTLRDGTRVEIVNKE
ncbi:toxin-antitoxin system YwqK family antitoxin [Arcticibacterium luteifluviistationis]|nr:hypothetical protein [Arcticibacterium luteifluviistationis]